MTKRDIDLLELMKVDLLRMHRKAKATQAFLAWEAARASRSCAVRSRAKDAAMINSHSLSTKRLELLAQPLLDERRRTWCDSSAVQREAFLRVLRVAFGIQPIHPTFCLLLNNTFQRGVAQATELNTSLHEEDDL